MLKLLVNKRSNYAGGIWVWAGTEGTIKECKHINNCPNCKDKLQFHPSLIGFQNDIVCVNRNEFE